jgi:hypothetical protein
MLYPRDPSLDPQLVWRGKDEQDRQDLSVPVLPVYIQGAKKPGRGRRNRDAITGEETGTGRRNRDAISC